MKVLVYSHDTFGLGNIRRMLAICAHLHASIPDVSILIVSGSPMLHSFRVQPGIDYIKLPCLKRNEEGDLGVRFLDLELPDVVSLRRELILATVVSFRPDVVLVDKKPAGLAGELEPSLRFLKCNLPQTRIVLILRDILDSAKSTIGTWTEQGSYKTVQWYYDDVLVLGTAQIFDVRSEYQFPASLRDKVRFCGYISREEPSRSRTVVREELRVGNDENLVLVTTGGGEDGYHLLSSYLAASKDIAPEHRVKSVIVTGPELAPERTEAIRKAAANRPDLQILRFTDDMISYMNAADVVVSMGGYNTICELLTLHKKAIVVPRVAPVEEQKIRAERMGELALFRTILPADLSAQVLRDAVLDEVRNLPGGPKVRNNIDLGALPRISRLLAGTAAQHKYSGAALELASAVAS